MPNLLSVDAVEVLLRALSDADPACREPASTVLSLLNLDADARRAALGAGAPALAERSEFPSTEQVEPPAALQSPELAAKAQRLAARGPLGLWIASPTDLPALAWLPEAMAARLMTKAGAELIRLVAEADSVGWEFERTDQAFRALRWEGARSVYGNASGWLRPIVAAASDAVNPLLGRVLAQADPAQLLRLATPALEARSRERRRAALWQLAAAAPVLSGVPPRLAADDPAVDEAGAALVRLFAAVVALGPSGEIRSGRPITAAPTPNSGSTPNAGPALNAGPAANSGMAQPQPPAPYSAARPNEAPVPYEPPSQRPRPERTRSFSWPQLPQLPQLPSWLRRRNRSANAGVTEQRTVYARLDAPEEVTSGQACEVLVGIGAHAQAGLVPEPFEVPAATFALEIRVLAGGFRVLGGDLTCRLSVTPDDPYPCALIRLIAEDSADLVADRAIHAIYLVDGQTIGVASRTVRVMPPGAGSGRPRPAPGPVAAAPVAQVRAAWAADPVPAVPPPVAAPRTPLAPGADWVLPADPGTQPDLTVIVAPGNDLAGHRLTWSLMSPHRGVWLTSGPITATTHGANAEWARQMMRGVDDRHGAPDQAEYLQGIGYEIQQAMPPEFWSALRWVAEVVAPKPPTLLLASWEPYIPWELAAVDDPWDADQPGVLGAQTVMGRWTYHERQRTPAPPATLELRAMAVVSAEYAGGARLVEAEQEAAELVTRHGAVAVQALAGPVLECLRGRPPADAVHFAVHGKLDASGTQDGLLMMDGRWLSPRSVRGIGASSVRLAFLNACQVGQGQQALGEPAGMAAALIGIGAGAVVAPLWKVDDRDARALARGFYPAISAGQSPGEYLRRRRGGAAETVSAYVYFGHPLLKVTWTRGSDSA